MVDRCIHNLNGFFFIPFTDSFDHHLATDEAKQNKSDPVVNTGDILLELTAKKPADKRHERLKSAEIKTDDQSLLFIEFSHSEPLTDRDCKGVHGKPNT